MSYVIVKVETANNALMLLHELAERERQALGMVMAETTETIAALNDTISVRRSGFALFRGREGSPYGKAPTAAVPAKLIPEANAQPHTPIVWIET